MTNSNFKPSSVRICSRRGRSQCTRSNCFTTEECLICSIVKTCSKDLRGLLCDQSQNSTIIELHCIVLILLFEGYRYTFEADSSVYALNLEGSACREILSRSNTRAISVTIVVLTCLKSYGSKLRSHDKFTMSTSIISQLISHVLEFGLGLTHEIHASGNVSKHHQCAGAGSTLNILYFSSTSNTFLDSFLHLTLIDDSSKLFDVLFFCLIAIGTHFCVTGDYDANLSSPVFFGIVFLVALTANSHQCKRKKACH